MRLWLGILLAGLALGLAGCASRPGSTAPVADAALPGAAQRVVVYAATSRDADAADPFDVASDRVGPLRYFRFVVVVPPDRRTGPLDAIAGDPAPFRDFAIAERRRLDEAAFRAEIARQAGDPSARATLFVHGYNYNFPEAVFRLAGIVAHTGSREPQIVFSWPSRGETADYLADREAAAASRASLARLLKLLAGLDRRGRVAVFGHSLGGWLVAEALRDLKLSGDDATLARLRVGLAAPDIDVDVFRSQMRVLGPLDPPLAILVSPDDQALGLSRILSRDRDRMGQIDVSAPQVQDLARATRVQIIDISRVSASGDTAHNRFLQLARLYPRMANEIRDAARPAETSGAFVFDPLSQRLQPATP